MKTSQLVAAPAVTSDSPDRLLRKKWFLRIWAVATALAFVVIGKFARDSPNQNHVPASQALAAVLGYSLVTSVFLAIGAILVASMIVSILRTKAGNAPSGAQWFGTTFVLALYAYGWFMVTFLATWIMHDVFEPARSDC